MTSELTAHGRPSGQPGRFTHSERQCLLKVKGVGPLVVQRLEEAGISSIETMRRLGAGGVTDIVCQTVGSTAWRNRLRSIACVIGNTS